MIGIGSLAMRDEVLRLEGGKSVRRGLFCVVRSLMRL